MASNNKSLKSEKYCYETYLKPLLEIIRNKVKRNEKNELVMISEEAREEGRKLLKQLEECAAGRFVGEFNGTYILSLLYPEEYKKSLEVFNFSLGSGAGEEDPNALKGGRRRRCHTKKSYQRSKRKQSRRRK